MLGVVESDDSNRLLRSPSAPVDDAFLGPPAQKVRSHPIRAIPLPGSGESPPRVHPRMSAIHRTRHSSTPNGVPQRSYLDPHSGGRLTPTCDTELVMR